jgi:hypothetical protein
MRIAENSGSLNKRVRLVMSVEVGIDSSFHIKRLIH